jgi:hypothetical protein
VREKLREGEADGWTREGGGVRDWMGKQACTGQEKRAGRGRGQARERPVGERRGMLPNVPTYKIVLSGLRNTTVAIAPTLNVTMGTGRRARAQLDRVGPR